MIPLNLEIEGFLSYRERQEIDFEELLKTKIFIIQGPTGVGKSSILDAMIFALYGKIPRFGEKREKNFFINHNSDSAKVSFTLKIREPGSSEYKTYRITRFVSRTGSMRVEIKYESNGSFLPYRSRRIEIHSDLRDKDEIIEDEIIGMPYDVFTKSVVLPQGKFMEFLLSSHSQRQEIILSMTDFGKIIDRIGEYANQELKQKEGQIKEIKRRIDELEKEHGNLDELISKYEEEEKNVRDRISYESKAKENLELELQNFRSEKSEFESIENFIGDFLKNLAKFGKEIDEIREKKKEIESEKVKIEKIHTYFEFLDSLYKRLTDSDGSLKEYGKNLFSLHGNFLKLYSYSENFLKLLNNILSDLKEIKGKREELEKKERLFEVVKNKSSAYPDSNSLREIIDILKSISDLKKDIDELEKEIQDYDKEIEQIKQKKEEAERELEKLSNKKYKIEENIWHIEEQIEKMSVLEPAKFLREKLKDGDICPVCGNTFREDKSLKIDFDSSKIRELEEEKKSLDNQLKKLEREIGKLQESISGADKRVQEINREKEKKERKIQEKRKEMDNLFSELKKFEDMLPELNDPFVDPFSDHFISELKSKLKEVEELEKECRELENSVRILRSTVQVLEKKVDDMKKRLIEEFSEIKSHYALFQELLDYVSRIIEEAKEIKELFETYKSHDSYPDDYYSIIQNYANRFHKLLDFSEKYSLEIEETKKIFDSILKSFHDDIYDNEEELQNMAKYLQGFRGNLGVLKEKLKKFCEGIEKIIEDFSNSKEKIRSEYETKIRAFDEMKRIISEKEGGLKNQLKQIYDMSGTLFSIVEKEGFSDFKEKVAGIFSETEDIIYRYDDYLLSPEMEKFVVELNTLLSELSEKVQMKIEDLEEKIKNLESEKREVENRLSELNLKLGGIQNEIEELNKKRDEKAELKKRYDELMKDLDVLEIIVEDFHRVGKKGMTFRDFVFGKLLEGIVESASGIFEDLTGRYTFKLKEKDIKVLDGFYGNMERDISSLSGGELFLASISLSFALSSFLSQGKLSRIECFFIDEGFGSLDNESIERVLLSLEKLTSQGIMFGIISHVESMQKIGTFSRLRVSRDERTRSSKVEII